MRVANSPRNWPPSTPWNCADSMFEWARNSPCSDVALCLEWRERSIYHYVVVIRGAPFRSQDTSKLFCRFPHQSPDGSEQTMRSRFGRKPLKRQSEIIKLQSNVGFRVLAACASPPPTRKSIKLNEIVREMEASQKMRTLKITCNRFLLNIRLDV